MSLMVDGEPSGHRPPEFVDSHPGFCFEEMRFHFTGSNDGIPSWMPTAVLADNDHKCQLQHIFRIIKGMQTMRENQTLCDITVKVEGKSFQAHRVVLAACSDYFAAMLTSAFQESRQPEVVITGHPEAFRILLEFAYSGKLNVSLDTVINVLEMAHYLQFEVPLQRCCDFLSSKLQQTEECHFDVEAVIQILTKSDLFGFEQLMEKSKTYLAENFKTSEAFLVHMTPELMTEMLERSDLVDEKEIFDTTLAWLQHNWEDRKGFAPDLLQRVRLGTVPVGHLSKTIFKSPDLYAIPECKQMIDRTLELHDSVQQGDPPLYNKDPGLFASRTTITTLLRIQESGYLYFDINFKRWVTLDNFPKLPKKDSASSVDSFLNVEGNLYVARGTTRLPRVLRYPQFLRLDLTSNVWKPLQPMKKRRSGNSLVFLDGHIYVIGSAYDDGEYASCEAYNISDNTWKMLAPLNHTSVGIVNIPISCVGNQGKIFAYFRGMNNINGFDYHLFMYDPLTDVWSPLLTCQSAFKHAHASLVVSSGKCYRILSGSCRCKVEGCQWHEINVHELAIDCENGSATIADKHDQALLPQVYQQSQRFFCISGEVFRTFRPYQVHVIGVHSGDSQQMLLEQLQSWWDLHLSGSRKSDNPALIMFTFDKAKWR